MNLSSRQSGAALLTAMLTVTLLASLASAMLWQQWRSVEIESAERQRRQINWLLTGAIDWARLILREDARSGPVDHLSEPWALPLQEARLSSFLAQDGLADEGEQYFLSGQITDQQARLNVFNLGQGEQVAAPALIAFTRLFDRHGIPQAELDRLVSNLRVANKVDQVDVQALLQPQKASQLAWLGLSPASWRAISSYITLLPQQTPVNLNTADAEVILASVPDLQAGQVQQFLSARSQSHFRSVDEGLKALGSAGRNANPGFFSVSSNYFLVQGRIRMDSTHVQSRALIERKDFNAKILWRELEQVDALMTAAVTPLQ